MKRFLGIAAVALIVFFTGQNVLAQSFKFAHLNKSELVQAMPEYDSATVKLEKSRKELLNTLEILQVEFNNKYEAYQKDSKNLTELIRQTKEQELADMNKRLTDFQNNAQTTLQEQQAALFQPVVNKADKAIKDVAKEGGFVYVFDVSPGSQVLYFDETKSTNITALVKTKLGMK
jgi:outer membrane protein